MSKLLFPAEGICTKVIHSVVVYYKSDSISYCLRDAVSMSPASYKRCCVFVRYDFLRDNKISDVLKASILQFTDVANRSNIIAGCIITSYCG